MRACCPNTSGSFLVEYSRFLLPKRAKRAATDNGTLPPAGSVCETGGLVIETAEVTHCSGIGDASVTPNGNTIDIWALLEASTSAL
mgnify:CR=1 FL=1